MDHKEEELLYKIVITCSEDAKGTYRPRAVAREAGKNDEICDH
jgi:hypothetical protein